MIFDLSTVAPFLIVSGFDAAVDFLWTVVVFLIEVAPEF